MFVVCIVFLLGRAVWSDRIRISGSRTGRRCGAPQVGLRCCLLAKPWLESVQTLGEEHPAVSMGAIMPSSGCCRGLLPSRLPPTLPPQWSFPECKSDPVPPGSEPFTVSPQIKSSLWSSPLPPCTFHPTAPSRPRGPTPCICLQIISSALFLPSSPGKH